MYEFFLAGVRLPVTPGKLQAKAAGRSKVISLISEGEVNVLKSPGLWELSFEAMLPQCAYPFSHYEGRYGGAEQFIRLLEGLLTGKKPFRFIVTRMSAGGRMLFDTNMLVSLEEYTLREDAEEGIDLVAAISLKEYRRFGTKTVTVKQNQVVKKSTAVTETPPVAAAHTVIKGDCLYNIALAKLGNGERYPEIYALNQGTIDGKNAGTGNPRYTIYPGQVLKLPKV